jgi:Protein of unknown function (DUF4232)
VTFRASGALATSVTIQRVAVKAPALLFVGLFALGAANGHTQASRAPSCRISQLSISPGPGIAEKTGQHSLVIRLTNRASRPCVLDGYPTIALTDARGALPFHVRHGGDDMLNAHGPRPVTVSRGGHAYAVINKYRCDLGDLRVAGALQVRLPRSAPARHLVLRIPPGYILGYCGKGDPGSTVAISPFEPSIGAALR